MQSYQSDSGDNLPKIIPYIAKTVSRTYLLTCLTAMKALQVSFIEVVIMTLLIDRLTNMFNAVANDVLTTMILNWLKLSDPAASKSSVIVVTSSVREPSLSFVT